LILPSVGNGDGSDLHSGCEIKAALLERKKKKKRRIQPPANARQNLFRDLLILSVHREDAAALEQKIIFLLLLNLVFIYMH